jgi:hypothetical protein
LKDKILLLSLFKLAKAVQEKRIALDDTIDRYIALPARNTYPTITQLVTHTSSSKRHADKAIVFTLCFQQARNIRVFKFRVCILG